jgi:hypothetical protein
MKQGESRDGLSEAFLTCADIGSLTQPLDVTFDSRICRHNALWVFVV